MKNLRYVATVLVVLMSSSFAMAQSSVSSYFLDGTLYNYKLNPSIKSERAYFSLMFGNLSFGTKGNIGISNFLYPTADDKLTTFMSGSVSADEFLGKMPDYARVGLNLDESILSVGFPLLGGFTNFGVSMHSSTSISLPKGLFEFAKKGMQNNSYSFSGLNVHTMNYLSATLGYSHEVYKGIRVGANFKYLMGLAHIDLLVDKLNVELTDQRWMIESHAQVQAALFCEASASLDENNTISGLNFGKFSPTSHGFGVDLGVSYDMSSFAPGLTVSASVLDLGFINWKHMMRGQSVDAKFEFTGFDELDYNDMEASLQEEMEKIGEDFSNMLNFNYDGVSAENTMLDTKLYIGAEYNMPFYKPLSVAVMYGQNFSTFDCNKWYDVRGYINISPLKWLEATVNYGYGTYGSSLGWMLNIHPRGFSLFVGSDFMLTKVTPQYIPVNNLNTHINFGINFPVGRRRN